MTDYYQQENNKNPSNEPYPVPKEVWLLVDRLYRHGIKTPGLFETPGLHSEILAIRDWLDIGSQDPMRILFIEKYFLAIIVPMTHQNLFALNYR